MRLEANPSPADGDVIPLAEFRASVEHGVIGPDDGSGYFATATHFDRDAPTFAHKAIPVGTTHVVWFNK